MILIRDFSANLLGEIEDLLNQPDITVKAMFVAPHEEREDTIYVVYEKQ